MHTKFDNYKGKFNARSNENIKQTLKMYEIVNLSKLTEKKKEKLIVPNLSDNYTSISRLNEGI
jgi:hypothetical protein